ncbi:MAG TPA: cupin domain-containing protein [Dongiaceae bacterium]|nr:cupin domain-containing protein [Dongiaceae bacterium]
MIEAPRPLAADGVPWTEWKDVPRFGIRYRHLTLANAGEGYHVGVSIEELPPGMQTAPAHYHIFEEEHVYMLEGVVTLRLGAERYTMRAGDYVCFPAGQMAGHCLINETRAPARYVILGENNPNEVAVYTDTNKVLVRALGNRALFDMAALRSYWEGEDTGLLPGEPPPGKPALDKVAAAAAARPKPPVLAADVPWSEEERPPGFASRGQHFTRHAVGEDYHVGVKIESPGPGQRHAPRHYHMLEEEHALILEGEITLLLDGGVSHPMRPGDYVCFPAGLKVGHSFLNSGAGPARYLMIGERNPAEVCVYPDSNKLAVDALREWDSIFDKGAVRDYWDGEG